MKQQFKKIIKDWVAKTYGDNEAYNPSWDINALAKELENHWHELYWKQELDYLKEDVENYAEENDYELTKQQVYNVADKIRNSDWYCSINPEDLEYYINEELRKA